MYNTKACSVAKNDIAPASGRVRWRDPSIAMDPARTAARIIESVDVDLPPTRLEDFSLDMNAETKVARKWRAMETAYSSLAGWSSVVAS